MARDTHVSLTAKVGGEEKEVEEEKMRDKKGKRREKEEGEEEELGSITFCREFSISSVSL